MKTEIVKWRQEKPRRMYDDAIRIVEAEAPHTLVAIVPCDDTKEIADGAIVETLSSRAKMNADLLAVAPELYAALAGLSSREDPRDPCFCSENWRDSNRSDDHEDRCERARDVLARGG